MNTIIEKIRAEVNRQKPRIRKICGEEVKIPVEKVREKFDTLLSFLSDLEKEEKPNNQWSEDDDRTIEDSIKLIGILANEHNMPGGFLDLQMKLQSIPLKVKSEKPSEGLEEEIAGMYQALFGTDVINRKEMLYLDTFEAIARHFAQWQKAQSDKELSEKIASAYQLGLADKEKKMMDEWLKDRDGCFWDGVEEGKKAMREQMMKEAVEDWAKDGVEIHSTIVEKIGGIDIVECPVNAFYEGQNVKIIIVKED